MRLSVIVFLSLCGFLEADRGLGFICTTCGSKALYIPSIPGFFGGGQRPCFHCGDIPPIPCQSGGCSGGGYATGGGGGDLLGGMMGPNIPFPPIDPSLAAPPVPNPYAVDAPPMAKAPKSDDDDDSDEDSTATTDATTDVDDSTEDTDTDTETTGDAGETVDAGANAADGTAYDDETSAGNSQVEGTQGDDGQEYDTEDAAQDGGEPGADQSYDEQGTGLEYNTNKDRHESTHAIGPVETPSGDSSQYDSKSQTSSSYADKKSRFRKNPIGEFIQNYGKQQKRKASYIA